MLVDHYEIPDLKIPQRCIDDGDDLSFSIAAASILAKVECDRVMARYAERYPGYGFERNKGYGTPEHLEALRRLKPSPIHRPSSRPVRELLPPS